VYRYDENEAGGGDWVQIGQVLEGEVAEGYLGIAIALNANGTIVALGADGYESASGRVLVYQLGDDNVWVPLGSVLDGSEPGDGFGAAVALSADGYTLVIGAPRSDPDGIVDSGQVVVFRFDNETWNQLGSRLVGEAARDRFGVDVSMGNTFLTRLFSSIKLKTFLPTQVSTSEDGKTVAAGAWMNDSNGPFSGNARAFTLVNDEWEQLGNTILGESREDRAGYSVSLSAGLYFFFASIVLFLIREDLLILAILFRRSNTGSRSDPQ